PPRRAAMRAADELPGLRAGTGLTILTWLMRVGFLGAPLIVGVVADAASLRVGLLSVVVAGVSLLALSGVLAGRRR
ncbi:MFS transporter, partial [Mycobacterium rufum]|nr:MFS transporter [Mycolicibacterium rufum]